MIVEAIKGYRAADLPKDAVAGLVIAALSVPIAMGYAEVVGLPAIYGLWASIVAPLAFGLLTGTRRVVFGMDSAAAAMTASMLAAAGIVGQDAVVAAMPLLTLLTALFLLLLMAFVIWFGKDLMVKVMSFLVFPFIASLVLISLSLIPYWNSAVIDQVNLSDIALTGHDGILVTVWLGISIMVFSFNFSPIVSSFVVSKREEYEKDYGRDFTERKCSQIISRASMLMVAVVMFFAFSCLFTLSPENMADAKAQNIPVLSYLANHFASMSGSKSTFATVLEYGASIIALVAIFKSFFGHYLGTLEGLNGLVLKFGYKGDKTKVSTRKLNTISMVFIMGSTWVVAYANPNILDLIEAMGAPIIASLLCLLPMYAIRKAPSLAKYRGRLDNVFVTTVGLLTILNIVYKLF